MSPPETGASTYPVARFKWNGRSGAIPGKTKVEQPVHRQDARYAQRTFMVRQTSVEQDMASADKEYACSQAGSSLALRCDKIELNHRGTAPPCAVAPMRPICVMR
jgi:hypothetical protein